MVKRAMIRKVAQQMGLDEAEVSKVLHAYVGNVMEAVAKGQRVDWRGFGAFEPVLRKGKVVRMGPSMRESMNLPARVKPVFVPSPAFEHLVLHPELLKVAKPDPTPEPAPKTEAPLAPHTHIPFF